MVNTAPTKHRYPRYPAYKPSGVEWLGEIPAHWGVEQNKRLFQEINERSSLGSEELLTVSHITGVTPRSEKDVNMFMAESLEGYKLCHPGDLVINTMWAWMGALGIANIEGLVSPSYNVYRQQGQYESRYLDYLYRISAHICEITRYSKGVWSSRLRLYPNGFFEIYSPVPSIFEQRAIVAFLDGQTAVLDSLIAEKQALIELLQEKRAAVIGTAVTQGLDPTVPMKDSGVAGIGMIPAHWDVCQFRRIAQIDYGLSLQLDRTEIEGTPIISLPNVTKEGELVLDDVPLTPLSDQDKEKYQLKKGDLLFNWRNGSADHIGKTAYFDADGEYTHVSFLLKLRFNLNVNCSRYFRLFLNHLRNISYFSSSKSMVNNTYNQTELRRLGVIVPPLSEQKAIAKTIVERTAQIDELIAETEASITALQEYRAALIASAVTGQIDVREYTAP